MRNLKLITIFCLALTTSFAFGQVVPAVEFNVKASTVEGGQTSAAPEILAGVIVHTPKNFKVAVKVGGEQYKTCESAKASAECKAAYDMLAQVEAGVRLTGFSGNLVGRISESKNQAGIKFEIPIFDDNAAINLKAMFGEDTIQKRSVTEYGAGLTVTF